MQTISLDLNIKSYVYDQENSTVLILGFVYDDKLDQVLTLTLKDSYGNPVKTYTTEADEFGYFEFHGVKKEQEGSYDIHYKDCVNSQAFAG